MEATVVDILKDQSRKGEWHVEGLKIKGRTNGSGSGGRPEGRATKERL